ncbi:MAG: hypothetical protein KAQ98_00630 [Bacteriovoracaceae bacterium]|nr:hypothetical protein [Bacteriovoracaceae bacterium]
MNKTIFIWSIIWTLLSSLVIGVSFAEEDIAPSCVKDGVIYSKRMNWDQRKELFVVGTITDCEGQVWNIKMTPGSDSSKEMVIEGWRFAGDRTKELFKIETYKKVAQDTKDATVESAKFTKESAKLAKQGVWDFLIVDGLYETLLVDTKNDWVNGVKTANELRGKFGWLFGAIYAGFLRPAVQTVGNVAETVLWHVPKGLVTSIVGVAGVTGGTVATVSSPVVVPAVEVLGRPLLALGSILTVGSTIPGAIYVWNAGTWTTTQLSDIPTEEVSIGGIDFITLENAAQREPTRMKLTINDFKMLIQGSILATVKDEKQKVISDKMDVLRKKLDEEIGRLRRENSKISDEHENNPATVAANDVRSKARRTDIVKADEETNELLVNDANLRKLVIEYSEALELTLTDEEIDSTIKSIKRLANSLID